MEIIQQINSIAYIKYYDVGLDDRYYVKLFYNNYFNIHSYKKCRLEMNHTPD